MKWKIYKQDPVNRQYNLVKIWKRIKMYKTIQSEIACGCIVKKTKLAIAV